MCKVCRKITTRRRRQAEFFIIQEQLQDHGVIMSRTDEQDEASYQLFRIEDEYREALRVARAKMESAIEALHPDIKKHIVQGWDEGNSVYNYVKTW